MKKLKKIAIIRPGKVLFWGELSAKDAGMELPNVNLIRCLRDKNPDIEFRLACKAKISKEDMEKEFSGNLKYVYEEYINLDSNGVWTGWNEAKRKRVFDSVEECDAIIIIGGPCTDTPNPILKGTGGKALPRFWRYWTPPADTLEHHQHKPWLWTYMDPRNPLICRDFNKTPEICLGFADGEKLTMKSGYTHLNNEVQLNYTTEFGYMEFLGTYDLPLPDMDRPIPSPEDKTEFFTITQHKLTNWRGKEFARLIDPLPWKEDKLKIYGDGWDGIGKDPRYLGAIKGSDLYQKTLHKGKYSFALPIHPGWATPKLFHMWKNDIVFFTDHNMDKSGHYIPVGHFTRVDSSEELYEKIMFVEQDRELYEELIMWQRELLHKHSSGDPFNELVINRLQEII